LPIRYKLSSYILATYFPTHQPIYWTYFLQNEYQGETKYCSVYVHPQLSHNRHPMDGALVGTHSCLPKKMWLLLIAERYASGWSWLPASEHLRWLKNTWSFMFFSQNIENHVAWFHIKPCKAKTMCKKTSQICPRPSSLEGV
jgi:hypothetical protein